MKRRTFKCERFNLERSIRAYEIKGGAGLFNYFPPQDPRFFEGLMTNRTFVEMINMLNEECIRCRQANRGSPRLNVCRLFIEWSIKGLSAGRKRKSELKWTATFVEVGE